jgi:Na+/H+ antiporter NhaA
MAMFVDNLAFTDTQQIDLGKISILLASTTAAVLGFLLLNLAKKAKHRAV